MLEYRLFSTQKKCALYKTRSVVCRGYMPPEFYLNQIVSKKFDIFSLGVVMIKIVTGAEGYHRHLDMPRDEFIDLVTNAVSYSMHDRAFLYYYYKSDFSGTCKLEETTSVHIQGFHTRCLL